MNLIKLIPPDADAHCAGERDCPAVYDVTDGEHAGVQGYAVADPPIELPAGEVLVMVPKALLRALAAQLAQL